MERQNAEKAARDRDVPDRWDAAEWSGKQTDNSLILDLSANYQFNDKINFFGRIENLSDSENILARQPYGARPNKDRIATVGTRFMF